MNAIKVEGVRQVCNNTLTKKPQLTKKELQQAKDDIIILLQTAETKLALALTKLEKVNTNDNQFDYCTSSQLANVTDAIIRLANKCNDIVYQK